MGGRAHNGSAVVMEVPVRIGGKSPKIVDTVDDLRRMGTMALERRMRSSSEGCPSMGRKSAWAAARA